MREWSAHTWLSVGDEVLSTTRNIIKLPYEVIQEIVRDKQKHNKPQFQHLLSATTQVRERKSYTAVEEVLVLFLKPH